jgi:hypothetical protein
MLGALVAQAHRWIAFHRHWQKLLDTEKIEFSHIVAMENREPPFEDWGTKRTRPFVGRAFRRVNKNCDFGYTVALSRDDYEKLYRGRLGEKVHKDGQYGLCARALIETVMLEARASFGQDVLVNFVFENNQHYPDACRIFDDLKRHVPEIGENMGTISSGEKVEFGGLQAADLIASLGRRAEPHAKFDVSPGIGSGRIARHHGNIPIFHLDLHDDRILGYCLQSADISMEKRWAKRAQGLAKWRERRFG